MNIIIPMAGMGKRLRPHTLTTPKPLIPVAGKPIVQHLVEDIAGLLSESPDHIVFVIGHFGNEVEQLLLQVAAEQGAEGHIVYQQEALGTAHAVWMAKEFLYGKTIVAFADTLFRASFELKEELDGILWVKKIDDPSSFGVVTLDSEGLITDFIEKPTDFVSDLAMIGIYYFKSGEALRTEIAHLIDTNEQRSGEYQLPDAMRRLKDKGAKLGTGEVTSWMDCGNPEATVATNTEVLSYKYPRSSKGKNLTIKNSVVLDPCYIGDNVVLINSVVGPHVSIGEGSHVVDSRISTSLIQRDVKLIGTHLQNSMTGKNVVIESKPKHYNLGDYSKIS